MEQILKSIENDIITEMEHIILDIIQNEKIELKVAGKKDRVGASISSFLEEKFCEYVLSKYNDKFKNPKSAPKNKTKNPWDAKFDYKYNEQLIHIWIDFKSINKDMEDSNPDMGSSDKIFKMAEENVFFLLYVEVYYTINKNNNIVLDKDKIKIYFLHNIANSYRRTPTNQMQVNINESPIFDRTFKDFLKLHSQKLQESYKREIDKINKKVNQLPNKIKEVEEKFNQILINIKDNID